MYHHNDLQHPFFHRYHLNVFQPDSTNGSSATPGEIPESFQALLKSLDSFGLGENEDDAAEFTNLLENMMGQLTSKEILYEPLKELATNVKCSSFLSHESL